MVELFPHLSYIFAIDYLHTICLGVTKKIMTLWFEGDKQAPYYVGKSVDMIDSSLKKLKTPSFITRKPKKIKGNLKRWKGIFLFLFSWFILFYFIYFTKFFFKKRCWIQILAFILFGSAHERYLANRLL